MFDVNKSKLFRIVFKDNKRKTFRISHPTADDTSVNHRTCELQNQGEEVAIFSSESTVDEIKKSMEQMGYTYDSSVNW